MTTPEWMDAFRRGDPENIGKAVLACIHEAYHRQSAVEHPIDIGELEPVTGRNSAAVDLEFCVLVGQVMREHGLLYQLPPDYAQTQDGTHD